MPFRICRGSSFGRPVQGFAGGSSGSSRCHCWSVKSPRLMALRWEFRPETSAVCRHGLGPPIGLGPSFFLLVPRHFHHHRSFVPFRPPVRMGPTVSPVAPPVAPRPPPLATPQAAQNQKLLNQLGFRPSR